ncbi:cytochrome c oxidase assembly protein [Serinicoccus sediminis]|uniref:cytochrome c oxidase assembly protein n=1 Tax=Serinicoccus sediminis TaxID=2306021 RepID=UPI0013EC21D1|nr:cytochrome c oxidase assembly protein [Serinicoccus sediminis]
MDRRAPALAPPRPDGGDAVLPRVRVLGGTALAVLVGAVVTAVWVTGASRPPALADPGAVVRWGLPAVTGLSRGAAALTVGALLLCVAVVSPGAHPTVWRRLRRLAVVAASLWTALQAALLVLTFSDVLGGARLVAPAEQIPAFLDLGTTRSLVAATVLTALVAVAALVARHPGETMVGLLLAAAALLQLAGVGHTGGSSAHGAAVLGLWLHTLAACVWVGGLTVLLLVVAPGLRHEEVTDDGGDGSRTGLATAAHRYSTVAAWAFTVLVLSGALSLLLRLDAPAEVLTTPWGRLVAVKVVLLALLGLMGAAHRRHTLPRLSHGRPGAFGRLAAAELLLMACVLGLSSALARTRPPHADTATSDPAVALTGYAAPPAPSVLAAVTEVRLEPVTLLLAGAALLVYLRWVRRSSRLGVSWPRHRTVAALVGATGFVWATNGGLAVYGSVQLSVQLAQQLTLLAVLPMSYVVAAPVTLGLLVLPRRTDGSLGPREWLDRVRTSPATELLTRPGVAGLHAGATLAVLTLTRVRQLVLTSDVADVLALLYLSAVGTLLAVALTRSEAGKATRPRTRILLVLLPFLAVCLLLGVRLRTSVVLVEPWFYARLALPWVANPLVDQRAAGTVVLVLAAGSALLLCWFAAARAGAARSTVPERRSAGDPQDTEDPPDRGVRGVSRSVEGRRVRRGT